MYTYKAKKKLEQIEHRNRTWKSEHLRHHSIWEDIVMELNSCKYDKIPFWHKVMDLYHEKYNKQLAP